MSEPECSSFLSFFFFFPRASETVREYLQSFCSPGQRLFCYEPTHMLFLLLVWLPKGHMPKGARSLEVPEVWETLGRKKKTWKERESMSKQLQVYCIRELWCVDGKCRRCARACRVITGKHLTLREKSEICQAHSEIKLWRHSRIGF